MIRSKLPPVVIPRPSSPQMLLPQPTKPSFSTKDAGEILSGTVQNLTASAPGEREARAVQTNKVLEACEFRHTTIAPRNMPGFKALDSLVSSRGMQIAFESDTIFTRGENQLAD